MPVMQNAHALVIGIANYQQINKLPTVNDAAISRNTVSAGSM